MVGREACGVFGPAGRPGFEQGLVFGGGAAGAAGRLEVADDVALGDELQALDRLGS